jgi:RND family efflux transporter MFP subunit
MLSKPLVFLLAALVGGMFAWMLKPGAPSPKAGMPPPQQQQPILGFAPQVGVSDVTQQAMAARAKLAGYVESRHSVRLTAQAPGRVSYIAAREGETVMPGQIVVGLDEDAIWPDYRSAWAGLAGDMAATQNAQVQLYNKLYGPQVSPLGGPGYDAYERSTVPFYNMAQQFMGNMVPGLAGGPNSPFGGSGQPMITQSQSQRSYPALNNSRVDYERQMAAMVAAQSRIDSIEARMRDRRAIASFKSVVVTKHVNLGDVVQPGQPLVDLADVSQLDLRIEVPTRLVSQLKLGDVVPVTLDANVTVQAQVSQIFPAANQVQRTVTVKLALPPDSPAAPGMYAQALLAEPPGPGEVLASPVVPTSAIVYRGSLPSVFVANAAGSVELRVVRLGETVGDRVVILSGLRQGEKVVTSPTPNMRSGDSLFGRQPQS